MSLVINTNVSSLNAQNNLSKSQSALAQATQRLSSGLKINSAADNAAGFAISMRYTTQIGGLKQASANASDAINLAQTAGSALDQVTANLQAIRDLAVQSANATYTDADRASIDKEVQQRLAEITRIGNQTTFNGQKILDGSLGTKSFQVGADVGQVIAVNLDSDVRTSGMGMIAKSSTGDLSSLFANGTSLTLSAAGGGSATPGTASTTGTALSDAFGGSGLVLSAGDLTINGTDVAAGTYTSGADLATAINGLNINGLTATWNSTSNELDFSNSGNNPITITGSQATSLGFPASVPAASVGGGGAGTADLSINGKAITGTFSNAQDLADAINASGAGVSAAVSGDATKLNLYSAGAITITGAKSGTGNLDFSTPTAVGGSLSGASVTSVDNANDLIARVDVALNKVSDFAANLGAVQNRFQSTIATLSAQTTNLQASQSNIQDADFAAETANLSKAQVLQQAGISVLAQANSQPQQVLKLLQ
ncbi:flagellin [Aerosticca soli]|uniref:Flagellin n=1 Tax=Aerosticca soli TaxID=2010829 RepID=A0A2Z6E8A9_9GAMM|nr:flagellin [Aerosticca soli]BBD80768.1 flagellin protein FlaB [Aerosticca soli]